MQKWKRFPENICYKTESNGYKIKFNIQTETIDIGYYLWLMGFYLIEFLDWVKLIKRL